MTVPTKKTRMFARRDVNREDFCDKLVQRWTVEHAAVTMYAEAIARLRGNSLLEHLMPELERFADKEQLHADSVEQLLGELGAGDVRAAPATPTVTLAASAMGAILDAIRAPTATARSILQAMLMAERLDVTGWELLTELAKDVGLDEDYLRSFRAAAREEREHELVVRTHLMRLEHEILVHEQPPGMMPSR